MAWFEKRRWRCCWILLFGILVVVEFYQAARSLNISVNEDTDDVSPAVTRPHRNTTRATTGDQTGLDQHSHDETRHTSSRSSTLSETKKKKAYGLVVDDFVEFKSSVDYYACCGAGHRMSKLANANYLSQYLNFTLRAFWGFCDSIELFHYLFGEQPREEIQHVTSYNQIVRVNNEVPGFQKLLREGGGRPCQCSSMQYQTDARFYRNLRHRFVLRNQVDAFRREYFDNYTVIGIHIRAGNGETGDFSERGRVISDPDTWIRNVVNHLQRLSLNSTKPPRLFVATDTPSMLDALQTQLQDTMTVLDFQQNRPSEGSGVLFGQRGEVLRTGRDCLEGWENAFVDMILLSHVNVLIAARPSSFTQSLPLTLTLTQPNDDLRKFCELNPTATALQCYDNYHDWCCLGRTNFSLEGIQKFDYVRIPSKLESAILKRSERPGDIRLCTQQKGVPRKWCLPYDYPDQPHYHNRVQQQQQQPDILQ